MTFFDQEAGAPVEADERLQADERLEGDEEYIELRPEASPWRRALAVLVVLAVLVGALVAGGLWWYRRQVDPPGSPGAAVPVVISKGSSTSAIGNTLHDAGIISNGAVFAFYVQRKHAGPFEAGRFVLHTNSDFDSVIRVLGKGPARSIAAPTVKVNVPEGFTVAQISERLQRRVPRFTAPAITAALASGKVRSTLRPAGQTSWEGLLFPATYDVSVRTDLAALLEQMAAKTETVSRAAGIDAQAAVVAQMYGIKLTPYQALIVASLIQEEAGSATEAPMVATVIYNRLRKGLPLGIDATSRYLAESTGTPIDFTSTSPYNTRRQVGLPPTPIAAPGQFAIQAALHPADGRWLYYVLTEPGKHTFAVTNDEFLRAKRECEAKNLGCG